MFTNKASAQNRPSRVGSIFLSYFQTDNLIFYCFDILFVNKGHILMILTVTCRLKHEKG